MKLWRFFRCDCGKLHVTSRLNAQTNCPNCGTNLLAFVIKIK